MGPINGEEEDPVESNGLDSSAQGEKIFVAVRLRPQNEKELAKNDVSDWECIDNSTILFKNALYERSCAPTTYTFDRVFGSDSSTRQVYEETAKRIALSALSGINSIIFAYGQTSSGKTYTMRGITRCAVADIYDYMNKHPEREFVLKFSAMEIYNELVKDLLCADGVALRLLDDPERGTVVEKLTEVTVTDLDHLYKLLSVCEAQRQTGETSLNEVSSRSHQILRLTIDSEGRRYFGDAEHSSTLSATVNFVDLAGSERSSQTLSRGTRLKEGSHINRSLLTLGTVIRKLSMGRNAHIPYRDSKLTRILQNSLGGNARTAIICTMSPARQHVDQSKNTLLFATCAKQVKTNARVNVVMSEKAVVKQLQGALAKLEDELRNLRSRSASSVAKSALEEKEALIEKMETEIKELTYQRDLALSRVETMLRSGRPSLSAESLFDMNPEKGYFFDEYSASELIESRMSNVSSTASHFFHKNECNTSSKIEDHPPENKEEHIVSERMYLADYITKYLGHDPYKDYRKIAQETNKKVEDNCKEIQCMETMETNSTKNDVVTNLASPQNADHDSGRSSSCSLDNVPDPNVSSTEEIPTAILESLYSGAQKETDSVLKSQTDYAEVSEISMVAGDDSICIEDSGDANSVDDEEQSIDTLHEDSVDKQDEVCIKEITEVTQQEPVKQIECDLVMDKELQCEKPIEAADVELEKPKETGDVNSCDAKDEKQPATDLSLEFQRTMKEIIKLWDVCHTPLIHRTYFFLLMKGDPSDSIYVEVELRRLTFLQNSINGVAKDGLYNSAKALNREREMLSRRMLKKFSSKEREDLFVEWGIDLMSKQRKVQLCQKLWTDTMNMEHINESAAIVAKLAGIMEPGQAPKEMFGLSFLPNEMNLRFSSWRDSLPSMMQF